MSEDVKVKPWWQSVSLWIAVLTVIGIVIDKLVAGGVIPTDGWIAIVGVVATTIVKRGLVESNAIKADAISKAASNPTQPPQG